MQGQIFIPFFNGWSLTLEKTTEKKPRFNNLDEYPAIMTGAEFANFIRISEQSLYNLRSTGGDLPPSIKISNKVNYARKEVEKWIDGKITAGSMVVK